MDREINWHHGIPIVNLHDLQTEVLSLRDEVLLKLKGREVKNADEEGWRFTKSLPNTILYDERGLQLFEKLKECKEYYLFPAELEILNRFGPEIAQNLFGNLPKGRESEYPQVPSPSKLHKEKWGDEKVGIFNEGVNGEDGESSDHSGVVIELGAGALAKTSVLLGSLEGSDLFPRGGFDYYALDLENSELIRTLSELKEKGLKTTEKKTNRSDERVRIGGLWAEYHQGLDFIQKEGLSTNKLVPSKETKKTILWLGSSIGNFDRESAFQFLKKTVEIALKEGETMLIGIDRKNDPKKISQAYNDPAGLTRDFVMNGLSCVSNLLGCLDPSKFEYAPRYNEKMGRHEAYYRSTSKQVLKVEGEREEIVIEEGEMIHIEYSCKYSREDVLNLFDFAGLRIVQNWTDSQELYDLWLVEKPSFNFSSVRPQNPFGVPTMEEWEVTWKAWDTITLSMIPKSMLHEQPIHLRHIPLFYLGHIPTFLEIYLHRYFGGHTQPEYFKDIFERGMDPDIDDPTKCHDHSIVPEKKEEWPLLEEITDFKLRVRERLKKVYQDVSDGKIRMTKRLGRLLMMALEHEHMHMETLLYILIQSSKIKAPVGISVPNWKSLSVKWNEIGDRNRQLRDKFLFFKTSHVVVGHNDDESLDGEKSIDGEEEFGWDLEGPSRSVRVASFHISPLPITNEEYLEFLGENPNQDLIPSSWIAVGSEYQVRSVFGPVPMEYAKHWPLQASGQQLDSFAKSKGCRLPTENELRVYQNSKVTKERNVGFSNFHPIPAQVDANTSEGHNGGVWEWTSSPMLSHQGYKPSKIYPGYSSDFINDNKHYVLLGGSWATTPRIANRKSFVNWFQFGYPFVFGGGRLIRNFPPASR